MHLLHFAQLSILVKASLINIMQQINTLLNIYVLNVRGIMYYTISSKKNKFPLSIKFYIDKIRHKFYNNKIRHFFYYYRSGFSNKIHKCTSLFYQKIFMYILLYNLYMYSFQKVMLGAVNIQGLAY